MSKTFRFFISIFIAVVIFLTVFISAGASIYTDWLWFEDLNFEKTFTIMFLSNFILRLIIGFLFTAVIYLNLHFTKKPIIKHLNIKKDSKVESMFREERNQVFDWLNKKRLNIIYIVTSLIFGFLFSSISTDSWKMVLKFFNRTSFNSVDPIFNNDIGFYVFTLPFLSFLREMGTVLIVISIILAGAMYIVFSGIHSLSDISTKMTSRAKKHLSVLVFAYLLFKAWDYRLMMYDILFSPRGVVFGAGYTDVNANLLGYRILFFVVLFVALAVLYSLFRKNYKPLIWGIASWIILSIVFTGLYPSFVQQFSVEPNEINREEPFIRNNIDMTREAYGLADVNSQDFQLSDDNLSYDQLMEYNTVVNNIRLWDRRPLLDTFQQVQGLRQYYAFQDVDIGRYDVDGDYTQVMLSARELDQNALAAQAQTWVNQTLKYTHGFGAVMSPAGTVGSDGQPEFLIQDIPPKVDEGLELDNSSVYYGEKTDNYVITKTEETEFHYPMGDENVFTQYEGSGGVNIGNIFRKTIYSLRFNTMKILLSDDINEESQIMYHRNIHQRVRKAAPFLKYDSDPYLVVDQGRLFWIYDAYTTTERFPYSKPYNRNDNYVRNSVKVVIDAYNGTMDYYIVDDEDPIVLTYNKIFADLFTPMEEMPESLREHLRYPVDLFKIQSDIYSTYHMKDPVVFYNREDLWNIPEENYSGNTIKMEPYYIMNNLPGEEGAEFILMTPFTPANRNNMIAWMAARNDGDNYGDLFVYTFPKDQLIYGPRQIESRIDQESEISQLLSLWSQRGSEVIRGNLLVIPVNNSILYVEPIFLQAEDSALPELRRVVVAYKDEIIMRENLDRALEDMFEEDAPTAVASEDIEEIAEETGADAPTEVEEDAEDDELPLTGAESSQLIAEANDLYGQAQDALQQGDFARYGEIIEELGKILEQLSGTGE